MCLIYVKKNKPEPKVSVAWKSFDENQYHNKLFFTHYSLNKNTEVPRGKWLTAKKRTINCYNNSKEYLTKYASGFHCFVGEKGAKDWTGGKKIKVLVKYVGYIGKQNGHKALSATMMYVPKEDEKIIKKDGKYVIEKKTKKK